METERGWIEKLQGRDVVLRLKTDAKCTHCGAKMICSTSDGVIRELVVPNTLGAKVGDQVEISYRESSRILSAFLIFIVPIVFLIAGYFFGYHRSQSEGVGALWAMIGLILGFLFIWALNKIVSRKQMFVPKMLQIVSESGKD